jgi:hypothetical protein
VEISTPRLHELLTVIARSPEGVTAEDFRAASYQSSQDTRGARRMLTELLSRNLVETRGARYLLSAKGLEFLRTSDQPAAPIIEHAPLAPNPMPIVEATPRPLVDDPEVVTLDDARKCGIRPPATPSGVWQRHGDLHWLQGPDGCWWSTPGLPIPPRTMVGAGMFELTPDGRVRVRQMDVWGRPVRADGSLVDPPQPSPPLMHSPAPPPNGCGVPSWVQMYYPEPSR